MKAASAGTLATLATGQFAKAELWQFDLVAPIVTTIRITNWDTDLKVAGNTYNSGFMLKRGSLALTNDLSVNTVSLDIMPQFDSPSPLTVGGYSIPEALRRGYFDGATASLSKLFMGKPGDTSNGATAWFLGRVSDVEITRQKSIITIEDGTALLNVSMPRNVYQTGCLHALFDAGCTLTKSSFESTASVTGTGATLTTFNYTGLSQATGYFNLGTILWTSGRNAGRVASVKSYGGGTIKLFSPMPFAPVSGEGFKIYPGCDKTQATCTSKFSNLAHFRGYPYIPVPETQYDGGTYNPQVVTDGSQGRNVLGSSTNAGRFGGSYVR